MSLRQEKIILPSAGFHGESTLPPVKLNCSPVYVNHTDEDDGLFLNYGFIGNSYPYRHQDMYDRELNPTEYEGVILENKYLKATFLPQLGGRLWSLIDKQTGKELLYANSVVRPCNLAIRNAWLAGGVEWNAGYFGHHPYTCSLLNTALTSLDDGTPVLRMYHFERVRCIVVQMDFFLPEDSRLLMCRMRITNANHYVVPMYWWSNIAVVEKEGDRVIVPADHAFTNLAETDPYTGKTVPGVYKLDIPVYKGTDVTYPRKNIVSRDYFWKTEFAPRKYVCQVDKEGYGLCQVSTSRLNARKLFVWGDSQGGRKWQNFLTADDESGNYDEIQCGLVHTQYECIPMPPNTAWEWLEGYGAIQVESEGVHGDWHAAQKTAENYLHSLISNEAMEQMLKDTRPMAKRPAEKLLLSMNDGWGALEKYRMSLNHQDMMCNHLDFGAMGDAQTAWKQLLDEGTMGIHNTKEIPASYTRQEDWLQLLSKALEGKDKDNWYSHYIYGTAMTALKDYQKAEQHLKRSLGLTESAWAHYAIAVNYELTEQQELCKKHMLMAYALRPDDLSLVKEVLRILYKAEDAEQTLQIFKEASPMVRENRRCQLYYAFALARAGKVLEAEELLCRDGGLVVPDIREGEESITDLWFFIQDEKQKMGLEARELPAAFDFRMFARTDEEGKQNQE